MGGFFLAVVEVWHQRLDELGLIHEFPFCISVEVKTPTLRAKIGIEPLYVQHRVGVSGKKKGEFFPLSTTS